MNNINNNNNYYYKFIYDGITRNYYDNKRSYFLVKPLNNKNKISFEIYSRFNDNKLFYNNYDIRIEITKYIMIKSNIISYSLKISINRDKYLGKLCGLFGYYQTNQNVCFISRDNLKISKEPKILWIKSYLDNDITIQTKLSQCNIKNNDKYIKIIQNNNDNNNNNIKIHTNTDSLTKCMDDYSIIRKHCSNIWTNQCLKSSCNIKQNINKDEFVQDCTIDGWMCCM